MRRQSMYSLRCLLALMSLPSLSILVHARVDPMTRTSSIRERPYDASCSSYLGVRLSGPFSLILTADPGTFSGTPEAHFLLANLKDQTVKPTNQTVCGGVVTGFLMTQHVVIVTTGIGPTIAALCTQELLSACGPSIREAVYLGTSGWSPQQGGVLNPPHCAAANANPNITRLGDVCVSPLSINWVCKKASWEQQAGGYPQQCFRPEQVTGPDANYLYGDCVFATDNLAANLALSDALISAARAASGSSAPPSRSAGVLAHERTYWGAMGEGTGLSYPAVEGDYRPRVWDYNTCAEVDGQFFYSGTPWEVVARDYVAEAISTARAAMSPPGPDVKADKVIAVAAMEGVGVAQALASYHRLATTRRAIPYTNVRTMSNYLHQPVGKTAADSWEVYKEIPEDFVNGYAYAIATGSATLLAFYQQRCLDSGGAPHQCTFSLQYP